MSKTIRSSNVTKWSDPSLRGPDLPAKTKGEDMSIDDTLSQRGNRYGTFKGHSAISQELKSVMIMTDKWGDLSSDKKEALEMIAHKIARILNGDPEYADSWHDICGYSKLVEDNINGKIV